MVKLSLLALAQVVYSAAYITYFSYSLNYGRRLIALHVCVMLALIVAATLASGVALRLWPRSSRIAVAAVSAFAFGFITVLYGVNLLSAGAWGHNVTLDIALRYLPRPAVLLRYLMTVTSWQLPALLGVVVAAGMVYLARSGIVAHALRQWLDGPGATVGARRLAAVALVTAAVIPAMAAGVLVYAAPARSRSVLLAREPLIGFSSTPRAPIVWRCPRLWRSTATRDRACVRPIPPTNRSNAATSS